MRKPHLRLVRTYLASRKLLDGLFALLQAIFDGFWLGLLDRKKLHAIDEHFYHQRKVYRTKSYNRSGLTVWESAMIERYFDQCHQLLVIGAGGGREVLALSKLGYEVDGFECNSELVAFANELLQEEETGDAQIHFLSRDEVPSWKKGV